MVTLLRNHPWVFPATNFTPKFLSCIWTKQGLVQVRRNFKVQIELNATERNRSRERLLKRNIYLHTNKSQQFQLAEGEWKVAPAMSGGSTPTEIESSSGQSVSVVQVSIPNQPVQVQSVIQSHVQPSVIHATGQNVPTIQVVRVAPVEDDLSDDSDGKKRREILSRRPSYRKILNELSSPVSVSKIEEESNSSQSQDGDSQDAATNLTTNSVHYQQTPGTIQISADGSVAQGLQMLTMTNASPNSTTAVTAGATIVQYATGPDGQQFYIPVGSTGTVQAYQIATSGTLPQGVVMATTGGSIGSPQQLGEEAARKRELRLLKNREAAKECRRKKKEYVKCLENRVAVLENQNKTLIEELKALKELYCQKEG